MTARPVPLARWRVAAGFLVAPLVGSFAFACWDPAYQGLDDLGERILRTTVLVAGVAGYPPALIFGLPAFLALRARGRTGLASCVLAGTVAASLPWVLATIILPTPDAAVSGARVTVADGARTWWGWLEVADVIGGVASFGALGGAAFWAVAIAGAGRRAPAP